ncbi:hypothetical protein F2Q69_00034142 [Brassica cretica]|uniref:Ataxin 2 SM domain-containing protein n=1 Tax=Brassica cretica TaxID=69181 RepID=A0A8S9SSK5_BRACR|nr:hypothetical protein F2Q69_00034142 [Brassica cretica]
MGYERKLEDDKNSTLLIATMCIIGLQVHVHVKDGSVFSGLFYTASVDNGFGIVLKNARITKKGKSKANVASGSVVETLVITSSYIVQIVAEGVSLPSNVTGNYEVANVGSVTETLPSEPRFSAANKSKNNCFEGRRNHHFSLVLTYFSLCLLFRNAVKHDLYVVMELKLQKAVW